MAVFNLRKREIQAKIVYYGPGLSGKTTNLQHIHKKLRPEHKGELMTLATQTDRTLFFDFLPIELGEIRGLKTRFQLYTVPGQVFYNSTRKLVLKNADGVVFVADSRAEALNDNLESLRNLEENLRVHRIDIRKVPLVIQYNKRDLPDAMPVEELNKHLNPFGAPVFEAEAHRGKGVLDTLSAICKAVIRDLREKDPTTFQPAEPPPRTQDGKKPRIETPGARPQAAPAPATQPSAPSTAVEVSAEPTGQWTLVDADQAVSMEDGVLTVPVELERDGERVRLKLRINVEPE
ncbi:MAG: hypothetical protein D6761_05405 [Candidatus Dadabacteria bacterium]|nr:MAG: hypothetical protein D6761_05405 [Candidatus Dadabacteria bacterium]